MVRDLNDILNDIGLGPYQYVQVLLIGGVLISDGAEILVSSSLLSALKDLWGMTPLVRVVMMSMIFVGVLCGCLIGGQVGDAFGRRRAIILSYLGIVLFGFSTALAQGPIGMIICRFFFGVSFGAGVGPGVALQVETAPSSWRAHIINLSSLWFMLGEVYTSVLLIMFMPDLTDPTGTQWRWVTILSMVPGFILFPFTYFLLQESPHFLLTNGRHDEAVDTVRYIATMNHKADIVEDLDSSDPDRQLALPTSTADEDDAMGPSLSEAAGQAMLQRRSSRRYSNASMRSVQSVEGQSSASGAQQSGASRLKESLSDQMEVLFSSDYRLILAGGCYLCFLGNFLFYGLTYALPQIFQGLGKEFSPSVQVLIMSLCDGPGTLLAFFLIYSKTLGHRAGLILLAIAASVLSLTLISIDHGQQWLYLGLPSAYLIKYVAAAFFTLSYVYLSEVFPSKVRASGLSLCIAAGRVGSISSPLIVEMLQVKTFKLGEHAPFFIVTSVLCLVGILMVKTCLHFERKNAPLQDALMAEDKDEEEAFVEGDDQSQKKMVEPEAPVPAG